MRVLAVSMATLSMLVSQAAYSQEPGLPAVNIEGVGSYCFFNSRMYSVGSQLCIPQAKTAIVCQSSAETQNKSGTGRAVWTPNPPGTSCK
jgi:hypothetical protein